MIDMSSAALALRLADQPGAFCAYGTGADLDEAFDDATSRAGNDYGFSGLVPSLASFDRDAVTPSAVPAVPAGVALLRAARELSGGARGALVTAAPICADSAWARRTLRLTFENALSGIENPGEIVNLTANLEAALRDAADCVGAALAATETFERVVVTTARRQFRPQVTVNRDKTESRYAVIDPARGRIVTDGLRTAGEGRRSAVAAVKQGPIGGLPTGELHVVKISGRAGGLPYLRVSRVTVAARTAIRATVATPKTQAKPAKTTGWLFYGRHDDGHIANSPAEPVAEG